MPIIEEIGKFYYMFPPIPFEVVTLKPKLGLEVYRFYLRATKDTYTKKDLRKIYDDGRRRALLRVPSYTADRQFLLRFALETKNYNYTYEGSLEKLSEEKLDRIVSGILETMFKYAEYGSEVETGMSSYHLRDEIIEANKGYYYEDGSCGIEFPTPVFNDWNKFEEHLWNLKRTIRDFYGHRFFNPRCGAGGHFNISVPKYPINTYNVILSVYAFAPLLMYLFQKPITSERDSGYRCISYFYKDLIHDTHCKYNFIHMKDYAWEIRFPDSLYNVDAYLTEVALLTGIVCTACARKLIPKRIIEYNPMMFYHKMILGRSMEFEHLWKLYVNYSYNALKSYLMEFFEIFERTTNIDLVSRLEKYKQRPKWIN